MPEFRQTRFKSNHFQCRDGRHAWAGHCSWWLEESNRILCGWHARHTRMDVLGEWAGKGTAACLHRSLPQTAAGQSRTHALRKEGMQAHTGRQAGESGVCVCVCVCVLGGGGGGGGGHACTGRCRGWWLEEAERVCMARSYCAGMKVACGPASSSCWASSSETWPDRDTTMHRTTCTQTSIMLSQDQCV